MKVTTDACVLGAWAPVPKQGRILDVGTGTGVLALMLAQRTEAHIDAIEIDPVCARQAHINFCSSPWKNRLHLIVGDVRQFMPDYFYDMIVCNPPYYFGQLLSPYADRNRDRHAVTLSLRQLVQAVRRMLVPGTGTFVVVAPATHRRQLLTVCAAKQLYLHQLLHVYNRPNAPAVRICACFGQVIQPPLEQALTIKSDDKKGYSLEFTSLMAPYYVHL